MIPLSYRSPKTEVRESKIHGRGLFARAEIGKGEIVAIKGGHIIDRETLRREITLRLGPVEIQIDDNLFIAPVADEERESSMLYSNHSCDPNLGVRGEITFVAMREIHPDEELTHDWAMTDDDDYSVECNCGASNWQNADRQRLATTGAAKEICWIFLDLSCQKDLAAVAASLYEAKVRGGSS